MIEFITLVPFIVGLVVLLFWLKQDFLEFKSKTENRLDNLERKRREGMKDG
jgi:hypothetical protein